MTELIDITKLSELWNTPKQTLRKMVMRREIPYVKLKNGRVRFSPADLEKHIKERTVPAKALGQ